MKMLILLSLSLTLNARAEFLNSTKCVDLTGDYRCHDKNGESLGAKQMKTEVIYGTYRYQLTYQDIRENRGYVADSKARRLEEDYSYTATCSRYGLTIKGILNKKDIGIYQINEKNYSLKNDGTLVVTTNNLLKIKSPSQTQIESNTSYCKKVR